MLWWHTFAAVVNDIFHVRCRSIVGHIFPESVFQLQAVSHGAVVMPFEHSLGEFGLVLVHHILVRVEMPATKNSTNSGRSASSKFTLFNLPPSIFIRFGDRVSKICSSTVKSATTSCTTRAQLRHCETSARNCFECLWKAGMKQEPLIRLIRKAKVAPIQALHCERHPLFERGLLQRLGAIQACNFFGNLIDAPQSSVFVAFGTHQFITRRHWRRLQESATGIPPIPSEIVFAFVRFVQQTLEPCEQCFVLDLHKGLLGIFDIVVLQVDARHACLQVLGCRLLTFILGDLQSSEPILGDDLDVGFKIFKQTP
mmetsp:Transcript_50843/g.95097  ORF Transcript_50843/g.95097 Transcript_50843/m.95097 type:complete len:312 (-) Transcript_50843:1379-2314(-)